MGHLLIIMWWISEKLTIRNGCGIGLESWTNLVYFRLYHYCCSVNRNNELWPHQKDALAQPCAAPQSRFTSNRMSTCCFLVVCVSNCYLRKTNGTCTSAHPIEYYYMRLSIKSNSWYLAFVDKFLASSSLEFTKEVYQILDELFWVYEF